MLTATIYRECLDCDDASFDVRTNRVSVFDLRNGDYEKTYQTIECSHERVCKIIDGKVPIRLD